MRSFSVPQDKVHNDREMEQLRNARDVAMASAKQTSSSLSEKLEAFGELRIEKEKVRAFFFLWRFRFGCICSRAGGRRALAGSEGRYAMQLEGSLRHTLASEEAVKQRNEALNAELLELKKEVSHGVAELQACTLVHPRVHTCPTW